MPVDANYTSSEHNVVFSDAACTQVLLAIPLADPPPALAEMVRADGGRTIGTVSQQNSGANHVRAAGTSGPCAPYTPPGKHFYAVTPIPAAEFVAAQVVRDP